MSTTPPSGSVTVCSIGLPRRLTAGDYSETRDPKRPSLPRCCTGDRRALGPLQAADDPLLAGDDHRGGGRPRGDLDRPARAYVGADLALPRARAEPSGRLVPAARPVQARRRRGGDLVAHARLLRRDRVPLRADARPPGE